MDMFNCDDVHTLLYKRKQKFLSGFVHLDSISCQVVAMLGYVTDMHWPIIVLISLPLSLLSLPAQRPVLKLLLLAYF